MTKAAIGSVLFKENFADCHQARDARIFSADDTGTDSARLNAMSEVTYRGFESDLHRGCPTNLVSCPSENTPLLRKPSSPQGYAATPLDGIWARAPYLHNGSIPTLYHLLVPAERPKSFVVGSHDYDTTKVGFEWERSDPLTEIYESGRPAQVNTGHDNVKYLGSVNWATDTEKREALLEYLKTL